MRNIREVKYITVVADNKNETWRIETVEKDLTAENDNDMMEIVAEDIYEGIEKINPSKITVRIIYWR